MADLNTTVTSAETVATNYARALVRWHVSRRRERFLMYARVANPALRADYLAAREDARQHQAAAVTIYTELCRITDGYALAIQDDAALVAAALAI